jgi:hypothetical protein
MIKVTYTAYDKTHASSIVSEGVQIINTQSAWEAEQTVKAMFSGLDVVIRSSQNA